MVTFDRTIYRYYQSQLVKILAKYDSGWLIEYVRSDRTKVTVQPDQLSNAEIPIEIPLLFEDILAVLRGIVLKLQNDPLIEQYTYDELLAKLETLSYLIGERAASIEWGNIIGNIQDQIDLITEIINASNGAAWGSITGTLSAQTDLQTALDGKVGTGDSRLTDARTPTGGAGGVLSGTYPNPGFAVDMATQAELDAGLTTKANTVHVHAGGDITSGTIAAARLGTGTPDATVVLRGDGAWFPISSLSTAAPAWGTITGNIADQADLNLAFTGKADFVHVHAGGDITSGTISAARLGSGTTNNTTFLRGDGTWQSIAALSATVAWGAITGTLTDQSDLNTALNAKAPTNAPTFTGQVTSGGDIYTRSIYEQHSSLGNITGATALNLANFSSYDATVTGNVTFTFSNPAGSGWMNTLYIELVNPGAFTITWPASVDWPGGTVPTYTAAGRDIFMFVSRDGGTTWHGQQASKDSK